jgi:hypothetical protein
MGAGTWQGILPIVGGIAGSIIAPGVGTMLGAGLGSLIGGAVGGATGDPRGTPMKKPESAGANPAEPMNRTLTTPPPSYKHGVEPEHQFFSKFEEGGPVLPPPQFNNPINPAGQTSMSQYFPHYTPTGQGAQPSWAQIAAATAPVLPPLRSGRPSLQATPFDPMTFGRHTPTPSPSPTPPSPPESPGISSAELDALRAQIEALRNPGGPSFAASGYNQGIGSMGFGSGYGGNYGSSPGALGVGMGAAMGAVDAGGMAGYGMGYSAGYAEGGAIPAGPAPMGPGMGDQELNDPPAIYQQVLLALQGRHPDPEGVIEKFIQLFGVAAFNRLRMETAGDIAGQVNGGDPSLSQSDGMSDSIPATVNGMGPARLSEGEFVIDAPTVAALGNGSSEAGIRQLEAMRQRIRMGANGKPQQQNRVSPQQVLPQ